jgi:hypothetical protein
VDGNDQVELGLIQYDRTKDQQNLKKQVQASCCCCQDNYVDLNKVTDGRMNQISFQFSGKITVKLII